MSLDSFDDFLKRLTKRLQQPLPGEAAHNLVRAHPVGNVIPNFEHKTPPKPGSVLILLFPVNDEIYFPLIQRPVYTGAHSGQVSFPGGKAEEGEDAVTAALREAKEEIGINPLEVSVIGKLSEFFVIPSNFMVNPVVAYTKTKPEFKPDVVEVEKIILGNLTAIMKDDAIKKKEIVAAGRFKMIAPHFEIESLVVWGATAMMLNEFRLIVRELSAAR